MTLIIENQTPNTLSYLGGLVTVSGNSNLTVPSQYLYVIAKDPGLLNDSLQNNVQLSDSVQTYLTVGAAAYLTTIATGIGGAVVGQAGSAAPTYEITIGGKDSNGKSQPARMNQFADLATNFRNNYTNITGNSTITIKSSSGTLHGILINNNSTGGTVTIYDSTSASGTTIASLQIGTSTGGTLSLTGTPTSTFLGPLGLEFVNGLTVVSAGSTSNNITFIYQ
jgi:hypothetical protein